MPLTNIAKTFLIPDGKGRVFNMSADANTNLILKEIAAHAGIDKNLSTHVARHTFATVFIELGGPAVYLMELLGHSQMDMTMRYVHLVDKNKAVEMDRFNVFG